MSVKTLLAAVALTLLPGFGIAQCGEHAEQRTQTCADGHRLDGATGTCVPIVSS